MECCPETDFMFPHMADVYYPLISQGLYNEIKKEWIYDRTIVCNATSLGTIRDREEVAPDTNTYMQYDQKIKARSKQDLRIALDSTSQAVTNILVTNIRNADGMVIFQETAGVRAGKPTVYEIGMLEPFTGPFGNVEYYNMIWRRTESQVGNE